MAIHQRQKKGKNTLDFFFFLGIKILSFYHFMRNLGDGGMGELSLKEDVQI